MSTLQATVAFLAAVVLVAVPVVCSLVICAPKWWRRKVKPWWRRSVRPYTPDIPTVDLPDEGVAGMAVQGIGGLFWFLFKLIMLPFKLALVLGAAVIAIFGSYLKFVSRVIHNACPYTTSGWFSWDGPELTWDSVRAGVRFLW